jgi:hypothetical protein
LRIVAVMSHMIVMVITVGQIFEAIGQIFEAIGQMFKSLKI